MSALRWVYLLGVHLPGEVYFLGRCSFHRGVPSLGAYLSYPPTLEGTWDQAYPPHPGQNHRHPWKHYFECPIILLRIPMPSENRRTSWLTSQNLLKHLRTSYDKLNVPQWIPSDFFAFTSWWTNTASSGLMCWHFINHLQECRGGKRGKLWQTMFSE